MCQENAAVITCPIYFRCDVNGSRSRSRRDRGGPFPPHLLNKHGSRKRDGKGSVNEMEEKPALYGYALVVVRRREEDGWNFLTVQVRRRKGGSEFGMGGF